MLTVHKYDCVYCLLLFLNDSSCTRGVAAMAPEYSQCSYVWSCCANIIQEHVQPILFTIEPASGNIAL